MALSGCSQQGGNEQILPPGSQEELRRDRNLLCGLCLGSPCTADPQVQPGTDLWRWDLAASNATAPKEKLTCSGAGILLFWTASQVPTVWLMIQTSSSAGKISELRTRSVLPKPWLMRGSAPAGHAGLHPQTPAQNSLPGTKALPFKSQELLLWKLLVQNYFPLSIIFKRRNIKVIFFSPRSLSSLLPRKFRWRESQPLHQCDFWQTLCKCTGSTIWLDPSFYYKDLFKNTFFEREHSWAHTARGFSTNCFIGHNTDCPV